MSEAPDYLCGLLLDFLQYINVFGKTGAPYGCIVFQVRPYIQYSSFITSHTCGIFLHTRLWCLPCSIAAWATPAFRRGPCAWYFLLPALLLSLVFLALLYMYDAVWYTAYMSILLTFVSCPVPTQDGLHYEHSAEATGVEEDFSF